LFLASVLASVYGLATARANRDSLRTAFPFGPFLAVGAVIVTALGPALWSWYLSLLV